MSRFPLAMRSALWLTVLVCCLALPGRAPGTTDDPAARAALVAALERLAAASSYRATIEDDADVPTRIELEFVAPDRLRARTAEGVQTLIGSDMYLELDGQMHRQALTPGALDALRGQWSHAVRMLQLPGLRVVTEAPEAGDPPGARRVRARWAGGEGFARVLMVEGHPVQVDLHPDDDRQAGVTRMRYFAINDPALRIEAPAEGPR
ncbi:MAG: hypothetical protein KF823_00310 [Xanthomonadales bacterium]|nr:hypothetical protein [Xanthomonadales bacterium]